MAGASDPSALVARYSVAAELHCIYVPVNELDDVGVRHPSWVGRIMLQHRFTGIARAELLQSGFAVFGQEPGAVIPAVSGAELCDAVRSELAGYWSSMLWRRWIWLRDFYVDLGLLTMARAEATLREGRLIGKGEAVTRLDRIGVPGELAMRSPGGEAGPVFRSRCGVGCAGRDWSTASSEARSPSCCRIEAWLSRWIGLFQPGRLISDG
ncbi:hypothetical protein [Nocardia sp. NBC_00511]|uniref:hypothetical protein n=1 Tax=Nocardia sp. NBC_00511 TaxID=2903591 RepID=UPI0030E0285A